MKKWKKLNVIIVIINLCLFLNGCENIGNKSMDTSTLYEQEDKKEIVIGASLADMRSNYQESLASIMIKYAENSKYKIRLELKDSEWDAKKQANHVAEFINQKVDAIILCPVNSKASLTSLKQAKEASIPVINLNMKVDAISTEYITTYVGASMEEEGVLVADLVKEILVEEGGNVAIIEGTPGSDPQIYRTEAFLKEITAQENIEIVGMGTANWERDKAYRVACDLLRKHEELAIIYAQDSNMAMGAAQAIEEAQRKEIIVIGIGEGEEYEKAVQEGKMYAFILQNARYEAETSIECAIKAAHGEVLLPWYKNPVEIISKQNIKNMKK